MDRIAKKTRHFNTFVSDCQSRLGKTDTFKHIGNGRPNQLYGEQLDMLKKSFQIITKYKQKFLGDRMTDIESVMADKYDKESLGSSSYIKHMRPSMIKEFEDAYRMSVKILNVDIFSLDHFPSIGNDGKIKYKTKEREDKVEEVEDREIVVIRAPSYAPCYQYIKESQKKREKEFDWKCGKDAWNL